MDIVKLQKEDMAWSISQIYLTIEFLLRKGEPLEYHRTQFRKHQYKAYSPTSTITTYQWS